MAALQTDLMRLEAILDRLSHDLPQNKVKDALRYALLGAGKRIRPQLIFAMQNEVSDAALTCAAALEMIHTYSLIHDDLPAMDNDDYRRGRLTVHKAFDEATAILAGDALLNLAFEVLSEAPLPDHKKVLCFQILGRNAGARGMILGQDQDMFPIENTIESITAMYRNKTGKLLGCALALGCVLSERESLVETMQSVGEDLGILFQIQDDLLEIEGEPSLIGKSADSDLKNDKKTYVALMGINESKAEILRLSKQIDVVVRQNVQNPKQLLEVISMIEKRSH